MEDKGMINEMSKFDPDETGLYDIFIWIGQQKTNHHYRIKVSNKKHKFDKDDCFVITIPDMNIKGDNKLNKKTIDRLFDFIKHNMNDIIEFLTKIQEPKILMDIFKKYNDNMKKNSIKKFNEFVDYSADKNINNIDEITDIEYDHLSPLGEMSTGLKDIVLWIGENPYSKIDRIKVSNHPNNKDGDDVFVIELPKMDIVGNVNKDFITDDKMKDILKFLDKNKDIIIEYSNSDTMSTNKMIDKFIKNA